MELLHAVNKPCKLDYEKMCASGSSMVYPGAGLQCLKDNRNSLRSEECKQVRAAPQHDARSCEHKGPSWDDAPQTERSSSKTLVAAGMRANQRGYSRDPLDAKRITRA